jgi:hypothetical protein
VDQDALYERRKNDIEWHIGVNPGITKSELARKTNSVSAYERDSIIEELITENSIRKTTHKSAGPRSITRYWSIGKNTDFEVDPPKVKLACNVRQMTLETIRWINEAVAALNERLSSMTWPEVELLPETPGIKPEKTSATA